MYGADIEVRWGKFGSVKEFIFLGNDVIAMASGIHVLFLNTVTREERIERFDSKDRGRGASCLAGHSVVPMFATAERRSRPKIFIFTYPGIRKISTCSPEKTPNGYLSSAFAGTDYLLTLTDFPNFQIILWLWRTGECLTTIDTKITDHDQRIACSPSSPYLLSQIGKITGELMVYEIGVCSKIISIVPVGGASALTTKTVSTSWTEDGNLLHCDYVGNVTLISSDGKRFLVVKGEDDALTSDKSPLIEAFRTGVVLVNKKSRVLFYRKITGSNNRVKSGSPWKSVWSVQATSHPTWIARCQFRDGLLLCTDRREIFELGIDGEDDSPRLRVICCLGSKYEFLTSVNRLGSHVAAVDRCQRLDIIQCITGQLEGNLCLKTYGQVRCVVSHPTDAIIAIGTITGKCVLVNLGNISEPSVTNVTHLQREPLDMIRYSWFGDILGAVAIRQATLFIIDQSKEGSNVVLGFLHLPIEIIDFLIYDIDKRSSKILVLVKTSKTHRCGRKMIIYSFDYANNTEQCERLIELPSMLNVLNYGRGKDEIIVVPYLTKQLHFFKIQKDFEGLNVTEVIRSGHQLRNIRININNSFVVTCSYDGLIIVRNKAKIHQVLAIFMAHHRQEGGAKYIFSGDNHTIVCLGRNGDVTATNMRCLEVVSDVSEGERSAIYCQPYKKAIVEDNLTWMEQTLAVNFQEELEKCIAERFSILQHFENLQKKLKHLLDTNDVESLNARMPISDFDLDHVSRSQKLHDNIAIQKDLLWKLDKEILQQDKVASYLRKLCWDCMEVPACSLVSITGKPVVDNFPISRVSKFRNDCHKWETFDAEFKPPNSKDNQSNQEACKQFLIMGTTTHRWLPKIPMLLSNQIKKFANYVEGRKLCIMIRDQEQKLKIRFNKIFEDMLVVKERELAVAAERIDDIRHCASELKNTFGIEPSKANVMLQPLWHYSEKPQTIVTVTDDEISSGCAVTFLERDVRQEIIKKQESEHLKLNDNFREAALEVMMDGLLEVRWEDDIKKGPPKPLCLSNKDPSNYTEEEVAAVEMYQRKCEKLKVEREKYRKIIEDKISKVQESLRQDANAFDRSLAAFYLERMNIESAVFQEMLMHLRELQRHSMRRRGMEMMLLASNELESASKEFRNLAKISTVLETAVNDTRNRYDNLTKRDRLLEGKLRSEFPDLKQPMVEHLLRQYRKRPRNVQFTCTSITFLTEIARCLINGEKSGILPRDCLEFLRGISSLDVMPNNLPTQIDSSHWQLLCKLRRAKIELEIKIKSCAVDLAQAEQTFVLHQKSCSNAELQLSQMKEKMKEREVEHLRILEDMQVQLVVKMGQIECRLRGDPCELSNAVLVPFDTVRRANDEIIQAGRKKIIAMRKTVQFRRTTLWQEWSHTCLRITLQDMKDEFKLLQGVKITKELQNYFQSHTRSVGEEKEMKKYERIVASTKKRFQRMLQEQKRQLIETGDKVTAWRKQNKRLGNAVKKTKLASFKASMIALDGSRTRYVGHRRAKLIAIMKRTRMTKKIQDNYGELQALQTQLELFRLKTYPTLRLKGLAKYKATTNKTNTNA